MIARIKQVASVGDVCERLGVTPNRSSFIHCPAHVDDTASLKIYTDTDTWRCFSCQKFGDVIDLVALFYGVSLGEAIKTLADWYGLTDTKQNYIDRQRMTAKRRKLARKKSEREKRETEYSDALLNRARVESVLINAERGSPEYIKALADRDLADYRLEVAQFGRFSAGKARR